MRMVTTGEENSGRPPLSKCYPGHHESYTSATRMLLTACRYSDSLKFYPKKKYAVQVSDLDDIDVYFFEDIVVEAWD